MPTLHPAETIQKPGCNITLRRFTGLHASDLFIACTPVGNGIDLPGQAEAIYRAALAVIEECGGDARSIVAETVHLAHPATAAPEVRKARVKIFGDEHNAVARTEIGQAPLTKNTLLEVLVQAVVPAENKGAGIEPVFVKPSCNCAECARSSAVRVDPGDNSRLYTGAIYGSGDDAHTQTVSMFETAEKFLHAAGMDFSDVARTWIYLGNMERDYPQLNRARREFFLSRNVSPAPASTGIGAQLLPATHDICLSLYAVKSSAALNKQVMTTPTLNEAPSYGADFSRGMRVGEYNRSVLMVSGTASLDQSGASVYPGDAPAQADRMLLNIAELLKAQGADFGSIVSAVTYIKNEADGPAISARLRAAGFTGFPQVTVVAPVCRPELLCETEALALLPKQ